MSWPWSELGLSGPADLRSIRRSYAQRLKTTHPEEDPEGFQRLHEAYQLACRIARRESTQSAGEEPEVRPPFEDGGGRSEGHENLKPELEPDRGPERTEEPGPESEKAPPQWDYERLFAEGEAEEREARLRKIQELREKNRARFAAQEREQRQRAVDQEETWAAVMAAAHALELLTASNAPLSEWRRFLESSVFWNVRSNLDFIFALEDFLEQNPDLPRPVRQAMFAAYEFEKGARPEYTRLCRLLGVSRREQKAIRRRTSLWRRQWRSWPRRRQFATVFGMAFLGLMALIAFWDLTGGIRGSLGNLFVPDSAWEEQWQEHALEWLEEDFGEPFVREGELFAPAADPELCFHASPYGERTEAWPGYQTNYPHILVKKALEDFAGERGLGLRFMSYSEDPGDAPGDYLLELPLAGAEEDVAALGKLVKELEARDWYQVPDPEGPPAPVRYWLFLCHGELAFYDALSTEDGGFDPEEAGERYHHAGGAYCRYILEHSGLVERHMGETPYMLLDQGRAEIDGGEFFWVSAADRERGLPQVHYLLSTAGTTLICLPQERLDGLTAADIYGGTSTHIQLENVGTVLVWDLTETE